MLINAPSTLSDDDLIGTIASLAGVEREATATLIAHLAELEGRSLHLAQGFRSLFGYCRHVLHCSEHESYNRMRAVHAARRFPVILPMLAEGLLHLTAVRLLAPHLKGEDHLALLGGAIHKSKREVVELVARWFPAGDVPPSIRKLPTRSAQVANRPSLPTTTTGPSSTLPSATVGDVGVVQGVCPPPTTLAVPAPPPRAAVAPLAADRYRVTFTGSAALVDKLDRAKELLSHSVPNGDVGEIVERALDALLEAAARRRHAATDHPRRARPLAPGSRDVPAAVERAAWARDEGRCAFVSESGRRCEERSLLEFHHVRPWAVGGPPTLDNIALRCRAHNAYEAAAYFGPIRAAMSEDIRIRSGTKPGYGAAPARGSRKRRVALLFVPGVGLSP